MREMGGHFEDHSARLAHVFWQVGHQLRVDWPLGHRDIPRGFDEGCKFCIGDFCAVHPETFDSHVSNRFLFWVNTVAHVEDAFRNPNHAGFRRVCRRGR